MNKFLNYKFLIRFSLGIIFLANALTAFFASAEFVQIIKDSFMANLLPLSPETFAGIIIGFNDLIVGLLLIFGFATHRVAVWAMIWLIGVMAVIGSPFDVLEHFGLLLLALALILGDKYLTKNI